MSLVLRWAASDKVHLRGLLQLVDMTSMAVKVEARVSFVDLAFSIPPDYRLRWKQNKLNTFRLLLSDEISEVFNTPKYFFRRA